MLHPLLYLSALSLLAGAAAQQQLSFSSEVDISTCPITFYGQTYSQLFVYFTNESTAVCFNEVSDFEGECFVGPPLTNEEFEIAILPFDSNIQLLFTEALPTLQSDLQCTVALSFIYNGERVNLVLGNFGIEGAVYLNTTILASVEVDVNANGKVGVFHVENTPDSQQQFAFLDITGCRDSGEIYVSGQLVSSDPLTCSSVSCGQNGVLTTVSCGLWETCQNNTCVKDTVTTCTVTGPTVINFKSELNLVQDRCAYLLLSDPLIPGVRLLANFQERRRKDVSFLDSVTLVLDELDVQIHLEQDGIVQVDGPLTLNDVVLNYTIDFSENTFGMTLTVWLSNYTIVIFFDGTIAQISVIEPLGENLYFEGLCGNCNASLSEMMLPEYSSSGCDILYPDTPDSSINCSIASELCGVMNSDLFASCWGVVDPSTYYSACIETLCNYPLVDGLSCEFVGAYAAACNMQGLGIPDDWRTHANCPPSAVYCQDRPCTSNEFCGEVLNSGETGCFCRALFASEYRETNSLGDPTVCGPDSASLTLVGCLLEEKGIDYSALHLFDPTCRGQIDEQTHMVTFSYDNSNSCGTQVTKNGSQVIYKNAITTLNSTTNLITRHDQVYIDFTCVQTPDTKTMSFKIKDSSVVVHVTSGAWDYTLTMKAYTDPAHTEALDSGAEVQLNQRIWVELNTDGLDDSLVSVVTDSCWATHDPSPNGDLRYDLITNGCAMDPTVMTYGNGLGTSNQFAFNMFQFTGNYGDIYLHCKLQLCITQNNCVPNCGGSRRRRRSLRPRYARGAAAFASMAWMN